MNNEKRSAILQAADSLAPVAYAATAFGASVDYAGHAFNELAKYATKPAYKCVMPVERENPIGFVVRRRKRR